MAEAIHSPGYLISDFNGDAYGLVCLTMTKDAYFGSLKTSITATHARALSPVVARGLTSRFLSSGSPFTREIHKGST